MPTFPAEPPPKPEHFSTFMANGTSTYPSSCRQAYPSRCSATSPKPKPNLEELIAAQNRIKLSPNPADQYLQIEYELLFSKAGTVMKVYDQLGREVADYQVDKKSTGVEILDTRKMTTGIYIVEIVQDGKQVSSEKFIVQH
ncbi:MAG: hypothetical protein ACJAXD_000576 [Cryomorphaceae bacterium]|jgi:hypothetical protein